MLNRPGYARHAHRRFRTSPRLFLLFLFLQRVDDLFVRVSVWFPVLASLLALFDEFLLRKYVMLDAVGCEQFYWSLINRELFQGWTGLIFLQRRLGVLSGVIDRVS